MLRYIEGDIFSSPAQVLVNPVNTVGVMGKGLALEFKQRYPDIFKWYKQMCDKHLFTIGKLMLCRAADYWVLLFPTKENWRNPSKIEYIEAGLKKFADTYADKGISSIAFPKLGCGNGELSWDDVRPVMEKYLKPLPIAVYIYVGVDNTVKPEHRATTEMERWMKAHARDMSFSGLCNEIKYVMQIAPYEIEVKGKGKCQVYWNQGLDFATGGETIYASEDELFQMWDYIQLNEIVGKRLQSGETKEAEDKFHMFCVLLAKLGYLTPIRLFKNVGDDACEGFQVNGGSRRLFDLGFGEEK